ncbi:MAG: ATP-binding protein [Gemmatimonadales bacterium]
MHSLLKRQLRRHLGTDTVPEHLAALLDAVDAAYRSFDADRAMLERSLELSSQELLQANSDLQATFHAFPDLFFRVDSTGRILECRGGYEGDFFLPSERLVGRFLQEHPAPGVAETLIEVLGEASREGRVATAEYTVAGAPQRHFEARVVPVLRDRFIVIVRDITERRTAEDALRARSEQAIRGMAALQELTSLGDEDIDRMVAAVAETASRVLDVERVAIWLASEDRSRMRCDLMTVGGAAAPGSQMEMAAHDFGTYLGALATNRVLVADDVKQDPRFRELLPLADKFGITSMLDVPIRVHGELVGMVCHAHVGPPRHWTLEEQIFAASIADLMANFMAGAKRRQLEAQLRQSQKMEAVGVLAGGVAHDFNNLLTAILGYAEMALQRFGREDPVWAEIEEVRKAGERAAALTRQLLAFSRKQVMQPRVVDLAQVVTGMEPMLRRVIGEDVTLDVACLPTPSILADPNQLEQVLLNLVVNAREAMPRGGPIAITVRPAPMGEDGDEPAVILEVTDSGVGMSDDTMSRIFEPFFTTKDAGKGTGLGLSTVYGIVKQSGGQIDVDSALGRGTTFRIRLPATAGTPAGSARPVAGAALDGGERILLVEDDDIVRGLTGEILRRNGCTVIETSGGPEAIELFRDDPHGIDLVLSDVVMPEMSGPDLGRRLAEIRPDVKLLFMSGYAEGAVVRQGVLQPGTALIEKPFTPDALIRRIRETLGGEPARIG